MKQQIISLLERAKENGTTIGDVLAEVRGMPEGWQPIETAPKDGAEIWGFNGEQARMLWSEGEHWALWVWADSSLADIDPSPHQPTHWMPIPAAPGAEAVASRPATPAPPSPTDAELATLASEFMMSGSCSTRYYFDDRGFARSVLARYGSTPAASADRQRLRDLVDVVWNKATESTAVPDTPWADRMIEKVFSSVAQPAASAEPVAFYKDGVLFWHGEHAAWRGKDGQLYAGPAAASAEPGQKDGFRMCAALDSNFAAGMLLGWNLCIDGNEEKFTRIRSDRLRAAAQASRAAKTQSRSSAEPVAWEYFSTIEQRWCPADPDRVEILRRTHKVRALTTASPPAAAERAQMVPKAKRCVACEGAPSGDNVP
ncbi:phage protein [Bordetella trematum]|uniref:hypothetical protein n=1 Tax=Bordetella trematum TaxID=123899 RepID=UPI0007991254|nr:hypothetical protein [Bordetella trematum]SAI62958.1 phage protein [Bordetella trematum]